MVVPLVDKGTRDRLYDVIVHNRDSCDAQAIIQKTKKVLELLDPIPFATLRYLLYHLRHISDVKGN